MSGPTISSRIRGTKIRTLNVIDDSPGNASPSGSREGRRCLRRVSDLFILRGIPTHIHSDNGPEFIAKALREWIAAVGVETDHIMPDTLGKTDIARASTRSFGTSCSRAKSSTRSRRRRSSSKTGDSITTPCGPLIARLQATGTRRSGLASPKWTGFKPAVASRPSTTNIPNGSY